jgi:hypothetical protein
MPSGERFRSTPRSHEEAEVLFKNLKAKASDRKAKLIAKKSGQPVATRAERGLQIDLRIEPGYNHQAGWAPIPDDVRPTACWLPDSGRVLGPLEVRVP